DHHPADQAGNLRGRADLHHRRAQGVRADLWPVSGRPVDPDKCAVVLRLLHVLQEAQRRIRGGHRHRAHPDHRPGRRRHHAVAGELGKEGGSMSIPAVDRTGPTETVATTISAAQRRADERASRSRDRFHRGTARWVVLIAVAAAALLMLVPFILMLLNAFKSPADYSTNGPLSWPTEFYTKGLVTYWNQVNYPEKLWNSTVIAGTVAVAAVLISLLNAYAI